MKKEIPDGAKLSLPLIFLLIAMISPMFIRFFVETTNDSYLSTTLKLVLSVFFLLWLLPYKIGVPVQQKGKSNLNTIGLITHSLDRITIWLGVMLGMTSLLFMFLGSYITGGYEFDLSRISLNHVYFSLVPGIFEEVVFRGFIMVAAIRMFKKLKTAVTFQVVIFTISHFKDFSGWGIVDSIVVGMIALTFTYVVLKTGHLYTAIIFHFIHDAFLFVVQKVDGPQTFTENIVFYLFLVLGMFVIIGITKLVSEKFHLVEEGKYISIEYHEF